MNKSEWNILEKMRQVRNDTMAMGATPSPALLKDIAEMESRLKWVKGRNPVRPVRVCRGCGGRTDKPYEKYCDKCKRGLYK